MKNAQTCVPTCEEKISVFQAIQFQISNIIRVKLVETHYYRCFYSTK